MITEQVEQIARSFLLKSSLRDPRDLSFALADQLNRLGIVDADESAESTDVSLLASTLSRAVSESIHFDVAISGDILGFFINKSRVEALFYNLLRSCWLASARKVQIDCRNSLERWDFSVWDDGKALSPLERRAALDSAYEVSESGELRVGDVSLFIVKQIVRFYGGDVSVCSGPNGGTQVAFSILKE